jgi:hypothetical protein
LFGRLITIAISEDNTTVEAIECGDFTVDSRVEDWLRSLNEDERWNEYKRLAEVLARRRVVKR